MMRYEDLEKAQTEYAAKEAAKGERKAKKFFLRASPTAEEAIVGKGKRVRR